MLRKFQKPLLFVSVTVISLCFLYGIFNIFSIKHISVSGVSDLNGLDSVAQSFLPLLHTKNTEDFLRQVNPTLASLTVRKQFPNMLVITARSHRPAVQLELADGYALLSDRGVVIEKNKNLDDNEGYALISYYQPIFYSHVSIGQLIEYRDIQIASYAAVKIQELGEPITTIDITNENMIVLHAESYKVLVTAEDDIEEQLARLNYTFTELRRKNKPFTSIDVRFERPIITLTN